MPDLEELAGFDPGTTRPPLPASEIRRRGDRRRRTTTLVVAGAAVAAAVAIGTPAALLAGEGGGRDVQPMPSPPQPSRTAEWVTAVPAGFPLTAGFADPDATPRRGLAEDPSLVPSCGSAGFAGFVDDRVVTYTGESEDRAVRALAVYPDEDTARDQLAELRDAVEGCAPQPIAQGTTMVYGTVPADLGTEESFAFTQQVQHDDGLLSELTLVQVARTGNALYVESSYGSAGGAQVVAAESRRLTEHAGPPLESMCVFAAEPCVVTSEHASAPAAPQ